MQKHHMLRAGPTGRIAITTCDKQWLLPSLPTTANLRSVSAGVLECTSAELVCFLLQFYR